MKRMAWLAFANVLLVLSCRPELAPKLGRHSKQFLRPIFTV